jgi:hypothetical protein
VSAETFHAVVKIENDMNCFKTYLFYLLVHSSSTFCLETKGGAKSSRRNRCGILLCSTFPMPISPVGTALMRAALGANMQRDGDNSFSGSLCAEWLSPTETRHFLSRRGENSSASSRHKLKRLSADRVQSGCSACSKYKRKRHRMPQVS